MGLRPRASLLDRRHRPTPKGYIQSEPPGHSLFTRPTAARAKTDPRPDTTEVYAAPASRKAGTIR